MLIAGTDTSAAALEWTMTELIRHPDVLAKAQHEVRKVVGAADIGPGARPPTAPLPEASHPGVPAAPLTSTTPRHPRDDRAVRGAWPRDTGGNAGAREREGHRYRPRGVGAGRGAVRARAARRRGRRPRRPQAVARRRVHARAVRDRPEELPRRALRHGGDRAVAGQLVV
jgi:hypothetical protein